jgi:hypothetical protein
MAMLEKSIDRSWDTKLSHPSSVRLRDFHAPFPSKPSATSSIASKKSALEFDSAWLRARNFRISRLSHPASKEISDLAFPCARNDFALPPTQLLSGLFS